MVLQVFYFSLNVEFMFLFSHFFIAFEWYIRGKGKTFYGQCRNKCPLNFWDTIRSTKIWEREFLVFHLYRLGEVELKMFIKQFISWERKKAKSLLCYNRFCTSFSEKLRIIIFPQKVNHVNTGSELCFRRSVTKLKCKLAWYRLLRMKMYIHWYRKCGKMSQKWEKMTKLSRKEIWSDTISLFEFFTRTSSHQITMKEYKQL